MSPQDICEYYLPHYKVAVYMQVFQKILIAYKLIIMIMQLYI